MRNPNWSRDELILALDLYRREPSAVGNEQHPAVIALSAMLNALPLHGAGDITTGSFRNPSGVGMKLANFRALDPQTVGAGLKSSSRLDLEIFNEFAEQSDRLHQVAEQIRAYAPTQPARPETEEDEFEAPEGKILTRAHVTRERNPALSRRKKQQVLTATGKLICEVCAFDFAAAYGPHGVGFAECHHTKPVSTLAPGEKTRTGDLAIVCANCHRMLHRFQPWKSVDELRALVEAHRA